MKRNITFSLIGLLVGVWLGFMVANAGFRREMIAVASAAAQTASQMPGSTSVNSSSSGQLTAEQRDQMMNQTRVVVDRARNNPNNLEAQLQAADQFMQIQRYDGALEFLLKANQIKPDDVEVMADLSLAYISAQKYDQAITWSRRALQQQPDYPAAMFYLAGALVEAHQNLDEAEQLLGKLEATKPDNPNLTQALAQLRQHLQTAKQSKGETKSVLSHGPEK